MAVSGFLGGLNEGLDLAGRQVLAGPKLGIRSPPWNCSENFGWHPTGNSDFSKENHPLKSRNCSYFT